MSMDLCSVTGNLYRVAKGLSEASIRFKAKVLNGENGNCRFVLANVLKQFLSHGKSFQQMKVMIKSCKLISSSIFYDHFVPHILVSRKTSQTVV